MRIRKINFQEINFEYCPYPQSMYDSIKRIGFLLKLILLMVNIIVKTGTNVFQLFKIY